MRILSYNIQAAINARSYLSYTWQWHRQILPGPAKRKTLARIAAYISQFDLVCLQEIDLGGLRNGFLNHVEQLRDLSGLPYALAQTNRRLGKLSLHGNLILSKTPLREVLNQPLPSRIPGRGVLAAAVESTRGALVVANVHLSLGALDQHRQLRFIRILAEHGYRRLGDASPTFPSWKPQKALDHAFLKGGLTARSHVSPQRDSDHLPRVIELDG